MFDGCAACGMTSRYVDSYYLAIQHCCRDRVTRFVKGRSSNIPVIRHTVIVP